jgi:hypothetical protein
MNVSIIKATIKNKKAQARKTQVFSPSGIFKNGAPG